MNQADDLPQAQVQRLAKTLAYALQIQEGRDELVWLVGAGDEVTNLDAITSWVRRSLNEPDIEFATRILPLLLDRLEKELNRAFEARNAW